MVAHPQRRPPHSYTRGEVIRMARSDDWVLLAYRLPRVPSTPRSSVWRKLKRLGVAQLGDGLVALPADERTREQLEWIAEEVTDNEGDAILWVGRPADAPAEAAIITRMTTAVAAEYDAVAAEATTMRDADAALQRRAAARLRRELHRIQARDYFSTPSGDNARRAVEGLAAASDARACA
jgi:ChrB-like protein